MILSLNRLNSAFGRVPEFSAAKRPLTSRSYLFPLSFTLDSRSHEHALDIPAALGYFSNLF